MPLWIEDGQKLFECEIDALTMALKRDGVVSGAGVTASATPDMNVNVAAGQIRSGDTLVSVVAAALAVTAADATNPRKDIVVSSSAGALSVVAGTAAPVPKPPALPAGSILLAVVDVAAGDTAINATEIHNRRLIVPQIATSNLPDESVTAPKLASGSAVSNIGYTPVNKAGDTVTGPVKNTNNANVDGPNFIVDTINKDATIMSYDVRRSGVTVGGIDMVGRGKFATGTTIGGNTAWHSGNLNPAQQFQASIGGFSNAGWTTIAYVDGSGLNSKIRLTMGGTANSVVVSVVADIIVNHSSDIYVQSISGGYTTVTLRILSDSNENFYIQATINHTSVTTLDCRIFTLGSESVTMYTNNPAVSGTTTLDHICYIHQFATSSANGGQTNGMRINTNLVWHDNSMANGLRIENRSTDPASPAVGQIWLRTDL
jgi:hypothetical protein